MKPPKTISEQIEILKSRGLLFKDESFAEKTLSRLNYYTFSGYLHDFKESEDKYQDGPDF